MSQSPHETVNPSELAPASGFSYAVASGPGRTVHLGGQTAMDPGGHIVGDTVAEQFDVVAGNIVVALAAAGAGPEHLVSLQIFVTDVDAYRSSLRELGAAWRRHFGYHYPAVALLGVTRLFDAEAVIEIMGTAVVPE